MPMVRLAHYMHSGQLFVLSFIPELERICINTCFEGIFVAHIIIGEKSFNPFPLAEDTRRGHIAVKEVAWKLNGTGLVCVAHVITLAR